MVNNVFSCRYNNMVTKEYAYIFTKAMDELLEENKILRLSVSNDKLQLVENNLRKNRRIREIHHEKEELRNQLSGQLVQLDELKSEVNNKENLIECMKEENDKLLGKTKLLLEQLDTSKMEYEMQIHSMDINSIVNEEVRALRTKINNDGPRSRGLTENSYPIDSGFDPNEDAYADNSIMSVEEVSTSSSIRTLHTTVSISTFTNSSSSTLNCLTKYLGNEDPDETRLEIQSICNSDSNSLFDEEIDIPVLPRKLPPNPPPNSRNEQRARVHRLVDTDRNSIRERATSFIKRTKQKLRERKEKIRALNSENISILRKLYNTKNEAIRAQREVLKLQSDLAQCTCRRDGSSSTAGGRHYLTPSKPPTPAGLLNIYTNEENKQENKRKLYKERGESETKRVVRYEGSTTSTTSTTSIERKMVAQDLELTPAIEAVEKHVRAGLQMTLSDLENNLMMVIQNFNSTKRENEELNDENKILKDNLENMRHDIDVRLSRLEEGRHAEMHAAYDDVEIDPKELQLRKEHAQIVRKLQTENYDLRVQMTPPQEQNKLTSPKKVTIREEKLTAHQLPAAAERSSEDNLSTDDDDDDDDVCNDYLARLCSLKRQVSDVETSHHELQLKAEELNFYHNNEKEKEEGNKDGGGGCLSSSAEEISEDT